MKKNVIQTTKLTDTLSMSECIDGFWLYDYSLNMNLSMRAKTEKDAFVEAIEYYQKRLAVIGSNLDAINSLVSDFILTSSEMVGITGRIYPKEVITKH